MSRNYKFHDQEKPYFVTLTTVLWIDVFTRRIYKDLFVENILYCIENKGLIVYCWCLMSNHAHLIIGTGDLTMQGILRDFKKYTSKALIKKIKQNAAESRKSWMEWLFPRAGQKNPNNREYQFWQQHNQPKVVDYHEIIEQKMDYIHRNPVKAGWVQRPEDFLYSSARTYAGQEGMLPVEVIR
ncbi:hypothetical protein NC796_25710 [Aliifodinibius sp. S!AR15-10]|uniref:REP-associated tyrosine transposase n=1 Tax=Aliifodinibius sp. S!AR15-10 TaxID=2950437 RepID=UPI0028542B1B|nr:transposase [Aliifodinibius sp. S!AR15-10]MDR8394568.1 hypothetical protein [Aliifodinibius sp. S!AR15-10]